MVKIYTAQHVAEAHLIKGLVEAQGIPCEVMNENLSSLRGELPMTDETAPTLCIFDESQFEEARAIIAEYEERNKQKNGKGASWVCRICGEESEEQFTQCWNCLTPRA
ncbi:MAG: DUF2007 domain-containing protein [Candidatus Electrothrix sp. ATG1]|nr:DUF2007 domain-containing protein [Candidatus Electrothrix sp. ATG1]MCI5208621.1 DUF2007 domain-containing protein [Candidatus Electrothrix sp. ATG2]